MDTMKVETPKSYNHIARKNAQSKSSVFSLGLRFYRLLDKPSKRSFLKALALQFFNSLAEVLGLGLLMPLLLLLLQAETETIPVLGDIQQMLGFSKNEFIAFTCMLLVVFFLLKGLFHVYALHGIANFSYKLQQEFSTKGLAKLLDATFLENSSKNSNYQLREINTVPNQFATNVAISLLNFINELVVISIIIIGLLSYDYAIFLLLCALLMPTVAIFYRYSRKALTDTQLKIHELGPLVTRLIFDSVFGYIDVKLSRSENLLIDRLYKMQGKMRLLYTKAYLLRQMPSKIIEFAVIVGLVLVVLFGVLVRNDIQFVVTTLGLMVIAAYRIMPSINRILLATLNIKSYEFTFGVVEQTLVPEDSESDAPDVPIGGFKTLSLQEISFSYPGSDALVIDRLSVSIHQGESVGFIGKSGSGKSSLIKLMAQFMEPTAGEIKVNGAVLNKTTRKSWWQSIGYVQQEVHISESTFAENIAFGKEASQIDPERLAHAIEHAQLREFVESLPDKEQSLITEKGKNISGGQKQRIGIARALYSGAEVFLFDEATSALDNETEQQVTESMMRLASEGYTTITVAHRLTTLAHCQRIFEMEDGKIAREYTFEELMTKSGTS